MNPKPLLLALAFALFAFTANAQMAPEQAVTVDGIIEAFPVLGTLPDDASIDGSRYVIDFDGFLVPVAAEQSTGTIDAQTVSQPGNTLFCLDPCVGGTCFAGTATAVQSIPANSPFAPGAASFDGVDWTYAEFSDSLVDVEVMSGPTCTGINTLQFSTTVTVFPDQARAALAFGPAAELDLIFIGGTAVPEVASLAVGLIALGGLVWWKRR